MVREYKASHKQTTPKILRTYITKNRKLARYEAIIKVFQYYDNSWLTADEILDKFAELDLQSETSKPVTTSFNVQMNITSYSKYFVSKKHNGRKKLYKLSEEGQERADLLDKSLESAYPIVNTCEPNIKQESKERTPKTHNMHQLPTELGW
jgi:hypothetical protein